MSLLPDFLARFARTVTAYAGDGVLMQAGVSAAANVIVADGEVAGEEFETALTGIRANPILQKGYDLQMAEDALHEAVERARTRAGRAENLRRVAAVAGRPAEQRHDVFLLAVDVADYEGTAAAEHAVLAEIAASLIVDKDRLLADVKDRPTARPSMA